jgi:acetyl esterase/lipase/S-formylglutathione hydrolase FrmB
MKTRHLLAGLAALAASITMAAQQGAPNEGRTLQGPALRIERNLEYVRVGSQALTLDLYEQSRATKASPVVVWIHGTESGLGSNKTPTPAAALVTPGYAVASIDYRTGNGVTLADQLADAKAAVRWLRANAKNYNLDGTHVAAIGYGIGGEIAALLGTASDVQAVVALAAPIDNGAVNPIAYATKDSAPTLILHGTADTNVPTWDSQRLVSALKVAGANATLELQIGASHDLGQLVSPLAMQTVTSFLDQQLRGARVPGGTSNYIATPLTEYIDPVALDLGGTLYRTYPTPVRGPDTFASYRIYLPPDYETNTTRRYPVIYFLHGSLVDSKRPITSGYIARVDAAIRSGVMPPTIVVIPQGLNQGRWMDSKDGTAPMETVFIKNLIPHIDANYRTIATRAGRAIEGHSMGGFGALHNGFNNPDVFIAVTANSPGGATLDTGEDTTPAPNRIDSFKVVYGSDRNYFIAMAPTTLAEKNAAKLRQQSIRIIAGTEDALFPGAVFVHEALTKLNIPHEFLPVEKSPHNHDQLLQYETFDTMAFYGKVFKSVSGTARASIDPEAANASSGLKWPPGYIEPNTPNMKYVPPDTPQGTGPYKAIMATDPGATEFVLYYPANLNALGSKKMPIVLWGNGSCTYQGNKFRNFLTEIASHGYLAIAGGPMGPPSAETITMASNNWTPSAIGPKPEPRPPDPSRPRVTVDLVSQGITWAISENSRQGSKFYGRLDTNAVAVMGQSCGAGLAASFGKDKRVKTIGVWSGSNKNERDNIVVPALYISGSEIYDVAYPGSMEDFKAINNAPIFHAWRTGMTHLGTYRQYLGGELAPIATAWLDWQLKRDPSAAKWFKGADCKLCKDTNWHVDKKKID